MSPEEQEPTAEELEAVRRAFAAVQRGGMASREDLMRELRRELGES